MKELVKLNKNLIEQLNICKNEQLYQKEALKKMKVMGTLLATLLIKKIQDNKNDEVKMKEDSKDNKDRKIYKEKLAKFFYKYIEYRKIRMSQIFSKKNNSIINLKNSTFSNKSLFLVQSPEFFIIDPEDIFQDIHTENDISNKNLEIDFKNLSLNLKK